MLKERYIKDQSLDENLEYSNAVIVKFYLGMRARHRLDYKFFVEKKEYTGSGTYYPTSDTFSVGDTIVIVYDKTNPDNNMSERDYY